MNNHNKIAVPFTVQIYNDDGQNEEGMDGCGDDGMIHQQEQAPQQQKSRVPQEHRKPYAVCVAKTPQDAGRMP